MKNKICLILTNAYSYTEAMKVQADRLSFELKEKGYAVDHKTNKEILTYLNNDKVICNLPKYDFVIYLDKDKYISMMLEELGYKLFNSSKSIEDCDDKMLTSIRLINSGLKMPKTISAPLCYASKPDVKEFVDQVDSLLTYPLIAKENFGSGGFQVYLINNKEELLKAEKNLISKPHIYQEYIKSSYGFDYRLIVIGGKVVAMMKRQSSTFKSNLAGGGNAINVNSLPTTFIKCAEKCAKVLKLDYAGVDLLQDENGEPVVCEVNSNAGLLGIEAASKVNVAKLYVEHILKNN